MKSTLLIALCIVIPILAQEQPDNELPQAASEPAKEEKAPDPSAPSPQPLLSPAAVAQDRNMAQIQSHQWVVETNWASIGPMPNLTLDKVAMPGSQPGTVVSNRYVWIQAGDRTGKMLINSITISNISRQFVHRIVRVFDDGTIAFVD